MEDMARMSFPLGAFPGSAASMMEHRVLEMWRRERGLPVSGQRKRRPVWATRAEEATYRLRASTGWVGGLQLQPAMPGER